MRTLTSVLLLLIMSSTALFAQDPAVVSLRLNQERTVPGSRVKVRFDRVIEDSRCPINARCVWAGNAKVRLTATRGSDRRVIELNTELDSKTIDVHGLKLTIDQLTPHPGERKSLPRLVLEIER